MSYPNKEKKALNKKTAYTAMFAALALIFSYVEFLVPLPIPVVGAKVGIANLVIIIAMYRLGFKEAMSINLIRIVISGLLFSGVFGILYSMAGGVTSLLVMFLLYKTKQFSMIGVSMAGGVFHNVGQLLVACFLINSRALLRYSGLLIIMGMITGTIIGFLAYNIEKRLPKFE